MQQAVNNLALAAKDLLSPDTRTTAEAKSQERSGKQGEQYTLESWMINKGKEGKIFYSKKSAGSIQAIAAEAGRKVTTEKLIGVTARPPHITTELIKVILGAFKKASIIVFLAFTFISCARKPVKPWVIQGSLRNACSTPGLVIYQVITANNVELTMLDSIGKYNMGDTIK